MRTARLPLLASLGAVLLLAACDEGARSPDLKAQLDRIEVCAQPANGVCPSVGCPTANAVIAAGRTQAFCAVGFFSGIDNASITLDRTSADITEQVNWSSSLTPVAVIGARTGIATAQTEGVTAIRAELNGRTGSTQLQVTTPDLLAISIDPPAVNLTVPQAITSFTCTGEFSNDSCPGGNPNLCDVTGTTDWQSLRPGVARVGNDPTPGTINSKGVMQAIAPGTTTVSCTGEALNGSPVTATASPVRVCAADLDSNLGGLQLLLNGAVLNTQQAQTLVPQQVLNLRLRGNFINRDENCGPLGAPFNLDLTESAQWASDRPDVATVGNTFRSNKGRVQYAGPGLAEVSATFAGSTVTLPIFAVDARIEPPLRVTGPEFLFAPGQFNYKAEAIYVLNPGTTLDRLPENCAPESADSENRLLCDVTNSLDTLWQTRFPATPEQPTPRSAAGVAEIPGNDGVLIVARDAEPALLDIIATFRGITGQTQSLIVPADLVEIQSAPGLLCLNSADGTLLGDPASQRIELDLLYDIQLPGDEEPTRCRLPESASFSNAELAIWRLTTGDGPLIGDCPIQLPVGLIGDNDGPSEDGLLGEPAFVSNQAGNRGRVTANLEAQLGLSSLTIGTACVDANVPGVDADGMPTTLQGFTTVLVATDVVPTVCAALLETVLGALGLVDGPSGDEPNCIDTLKALSEEDGGGEEGGGDGDGGGDDGLTGTPLDIILDILLDGLGLL